METVETICNDCQYRGICQEPCDDWYDALQEEYLTPKSGRKE